MHNINWDNPAERLALIERIGIPAYNAAITAFMAQLPAIHTVSTRFGTLFAVKGTKSAFSTRAQAEAYLAEVSRG
jgi:hypothetical protein